MQPMVGELNLQHKPFLREDISMPCTPQEAGRRTSMSSPQCYSWDTDHCESSASMATLLKRSHSTDLFHDQASGEKLQPFFSNLSCQIRNSCIGCSQCSCWSYLPGLKDKFKWWCGVFHVCFTCWLLGGVASSTSIRLSMRRFWGSKKCR